MGFGVWGWGLGVWGLELRVWGLGLTGLPGEMVAAKEAVISPENCRAVKRRATTVGVGVRILGWKVCG